MFEFENVNSKLAFKNQLRHSTAGEESPFYLSSFRKPLKHEILHFAAGWPVKANSLYTYIIQLIGILEHPHSQ